MSGKQYETVIRGDALEFKNVGRIKDQSVEHLTELFDEYLESRLNVVESNDRIFAGKVIDDIPDALSRELHFEDIVFEHHPSEPKASFELEAKTFIDYRYVKTQAKNDF